MKKFLKILLCLILIFSLAAKNEAKAEGGIKNIHIDRNINGVLDICQIIFNGIHMLSGILVFECLNIVS